MTKYVILYTLRDDCGIQDANIIQRCFNSMEAAKSYIKDILMVKMHATDKFKEYVQVEIEEYEDRTPVAVIPTIDVNFYDKDDGGIIFFDRYTIIEAQSEEE